VGTEKTKKLPKGVGKRIVASLKNQEVQTDYEEEIVKELEYPNEAEEKTEEEQEEETLLCVAAEKQKPSEEETYECSPQAQPKAAMQEEAKYDEEYDYNQKKSAPTPVISDVDTLLDLISRLPSGVTKQTGALIIRQTMEAMGMPMNKVLANAQSSQEELENNIRNNVNIIEEYRTNIKILEQEIQKFRKKAHELEDIISLFILSEEKR